MEDLGPPFSCPFKVVSQQRDEFAGGVPSKRCCHRPEGLCRAKVMDQKLVSLILSCLLAAIIVTVIIIAASTFLATFRWGSPIGVSGFRA